MAKEFPLSYAFDDVLLRPCGSDVEPSEAELKTEAIKGLFLDLPMLSAAMDRVTEEKMAIELGRLGGLGVLHRNCPTEVQAGMVKAVKSKKLLVAAACGPFDSDRALALEKAGCDAIIVDCAHGHNHRVVRSARDIRKKIRKSKVVVGNIATREAARALVSFADAIKVGVGPGSICTTRLVSGVGVPQLSAVMEVAEVAKRYKVPVIADGGIRRSGDIVKAFAVGASSVMLGNLLAGTDETPGKIVRVRGKRFKEYRGMGSKAVLKTKISSDRYFVKDKGAIIEEGVEALIAYKGPVKHVINELAGGIRVGMGYLGAKRISDMPRKASFVYITKAAMRESQPHNLDIIKG